MPAAGERRFAIGHPGRGASIGRRHDRVILAVLLASVAAPIIVATITVASKPWLPSADVALILLRSLDLAGHLPLTGPYSRFGFDHPGPLLFYVMALPVRLGGPAGLLIAAGAFNAGAAMGACYVCWRRGGVVLAPLAALVLIVFEHAMGDALVDAWNPWIPVLPFFLAVVLTWSVMCRDWRCLPWLVLAASFSAQAHLSYAPICGLLVVGSFAWAVVAKLRPPPPEPERDDRPSLPILGITAIVLVALWLAPIVQELGAGEGNLTLIAKHFLSDHSNEPNTNFFTQTERPSGEAVIGVTAREFGLIPPWTGAAEPFNPFAASVTGVPTWYLLPPFALFALAAVVGWRRGTRDALRLQALLFALTIMAFVSISRITGGMPPYLLRWTWVLSSLVLLSSVWTLVSALAIRPGTTHDPAGDTTDDTIDDTTPETVPAPVGIALAACVAVIGITVGFLGTRVLAPDHAASDQAVHVIDQMVQSAPPGKELRVIAGGGEGLGVAAGLGTELMRRGLPAVVDQAEASRVGAHRVGTDPHPAVFLVLTGADIDNFRPTPNHLLVATYDPMDAAERADRQNLQARAGVNYIALVQGHPQPDPFSPDDQARYDAYAARGDKIAVYLDPTGGQ